jgi:hypothetical protein
MRGLGSDESRPTEMLDRQELDVGTLARATVATHE